MINFRKHALLITSLITVATLSIPVILNSFQDLSIIQNAQASVKTLKTSSGEEYTVGSQFNEVGEEIINNSGDQKTLDPRFHEDDKGVYKEGVNYAPNFNGSFCDYNPEYCGDNAGGSNNYNKSSGNYKCRTIFCNITQISKTIQNIDTNKLNIDVKNITKAIKVSSKRIKQIHTNLDKMLNGGMTLEEAYKIGITGKKKGSEEYLIVKSWYENKNKEEKEDKKKKEEDFKINNTYSAIGIRNGNKKEINFDILLRGNTDSKKSNGKPLYIFIHGWKNTPDNWAEMMSRDVSFKNTENQVLLINWGNIVSKKNDGGLSPDVSSTWIESVAEETAEALKKWDVDPNKTTIIGHSLGALLSKELAAKLEKQGGNVNLITLDPAAYIGTLNYKINIKGDEFEGFKHKGACLVADASLSGSETLMKTCREGYLIDYSGNPDFPLFNELYDYVDFVIDESVANTLEYVTDKGVTYAVEKMVQKKIGGRIRGVRMYRIMNGQLKEVFIENIEQKACAIVNGTASLPYICQYGLKEIKDRFVKYHNDVHKVYKTIIDNPFSKDMLSPNKISLQKGKNAPFAILEKNAHGIIYTERDDPDHIKYLKVLKSKNSNRYTLYGNTQSNTFECGVGKDCEVYGGGGDDKFTHKIQPNNLYIQDFKENENDGDKIYIPDGYSDIKATKNRSNSINIVGSYIVKSRRRKTTKYLNITLENTNWGLKEVGEWIEDMNNKDGKIDYFDLQKLPIIIN